MGSTNTKSSLVINEKGIFMKDNTVNNESSLIINEEGIFMKDGNDHLKITKDGISMNDGNNKLKEYPNNHSYWFFIAKGISTVCKNNNCVEFECNDRVNVKGNDVYCGSELYYKYVNEAYVNQRS